MNEKVRAAASGFVKAMTLTDATMLVAGSMVGSGIFIVSADIGRALATPTLLLGAWVVAGVITLLGALSYGELAAMFPSAGGQYVFLRESLGRVTGFLYGWTLFSVIQTGTIAAVAVACGRFLGVLVPGLSPERYAWFPRAGVCVAALGCGDPAGAIQLGLSPQRLVALVTVWSLTWVNLRGVRGGKLVQTALGAVKALTLVALVVLAFTVGRNDTALDANFGARRRRPRPGRAAVVFGAPVGSLSPATPENVTFAAAEVKNPGGIAARPRARRAVTLIYVNNLASSTSRAARRGRRTCSRAIAHATRSGGTAVAEVIFGGSGRSSWPGAPGLVRRMRERDDPRRPRVYYAGEGGVDSARR